VKALFSLLCKAFEITLQLLLQLLLLGVDVHVLVIFLVLGGEDGQWKCRQRPERCPKGRHSGPKRQQRGRA